MGKTAHQKELLARYRERQVVGGICCVRCTANGKVLLLSAGDPESQRSRFGFAVASGTPLLPAMAGDWQLFGADAFLFEVLEKLEKAPEQDDGAFHADLDALAQLWRERLASQGTEFY